MGFEMAMSELSLVLFTTIAPSGAVAVALMVVCSLLASKNARRSKEGIAASSDDGAGGAGVAPSAPSEAVPGERSIRTRIDQRLWPPIVISLVGLVASSTHLGNPANALYVLLGVGSSPLSNEVAAAVVFLGLSGMYWLLSFSRRGFWGVRTAVACLIVLASAVFVTAVAFAYDTVTVPTWHTPYVPAGLWATALCGGPLLALATMRWACPRCLPEKLQSSFAVLSAAGLVGGVVMHLLQYRVLLDAENALASGIELVPQYLPMVAAFTVLSLVGWCLVVLPLASGKRPEEGAPSARFVVRNFAGCFFVFAGIFIVRFAFYMMHLTV